MYPKPTSIINNSRGCQKHIITIAPTCNILKFQIMDDFQGLLNPASVIFLLTLTASLFKVER